MICVGIDVSKRKSTVCFMAPGDKIIRRPFDVKHTKRNFSLWSMKFGYKQSMTR